MNKEPKVYIVGRQSSNSTADISIPKNEDTVGRCHIDLTVASDGRYYINEPAETTNGTFVFKKGKWIKTGACYVDFRSPLRLGNYETTVEYLLSLLPAGPPPIPQAPTNNQPLPETELPSGSNEPYWDDEAGKMRYE